MCVLVAAAAIAGKVKVETWLFRPQSSLDMAPKARKSQGKAPASELPLASDDWGDNSRGNACAQNLIHVHEALKVIRDCKAFEGVESAAPLDLSQGAQCAPFNADHALEVLSKDESNFYTCGANFFWCDQIWLPNHRVPMNKAHIQEIQRFVLPPMEPPKAFPYEITAAVSAALEQELQKKGSFQRLSPPEPCHALLFSIQEAIQAGASDSVLRRWRTLLLTTPFRFEVVVPGEDRFWRAQNLREVYVEKGLTVRLSVVQRIHDIAGFKAHKEEHQRGSLSNQAIAEAYMKRLKAAKGSEPISLAFVDCALTVHSRVLSISRCRELLEELDTQFLCGNPLSSVYALQALVDRAQTPEHITWALEGLLDGFAKGFLDAGHFKVSKLKDPRNSFCPEFVEHALVVLRAYYLYFGP